LASEGEKKAEGGYQEIGMMLQTMMDHPERFAPASQKAA
jgi:hypothetical protein